MLLLVAFLVAAVSSRLAWPVLRPLLNQPAFLRENWRGRLVPTAGGLVLLVGVLVGVLILSLGWRAGLDPGDDGRELRTAMVVAVVGFGLLGLLDDLAGDRGPSGYRGHLQALLQGDVTTGLVKTIGGGLLALAVTVMAVDEGVALLLIDGAVVALSANLANLLDRRPGRVIKVGLATFAVLALSSLADPRLAGSALTAGAAAGLLVPDLREEVMIGDTGANPLGAALGLGIVVTFGVPVRLAVLVLVAVLNLVSERVSFTSVIERTAALRWLDHLGRPTG